MRCPHSFLTPEEDGLLSDWLMQIPVFHAVRRIIRVPDESGKDSQMLEKWQERYGAEKTADGYVSAQAGANVLLRPSRSGLTATLFAEANSMEAASEIAGDIASFFR